MKEFIDVTKILGDTERNSYYYAIYRKLEEIAQETERPDEEERYNQIKEIVIDALRNKTLTKRDFENVAHFYLVIDEINRGNISGIFGELITLLEKDKRIGGENPVVVTLPYSKKPFGVPINLYIIGTMNTADRSIAFLDWALRRRFNFVEVGPNPKLLSGKNVEFKSDSKDSRPIVINLKELLEKLNEKLLEVGVSRDQRIGHTYFIDANSPGKLYIRMYQQVIPLIMEYLYNDPTGLGKVLKSLVVVKSNGLVEIKDPCRDGIDEECLYKFGEMLRELTKGESRST